MYLEKPQLTEPETSKPSIMKKTVIWYLKFLANSGPLEQVNIY